jgi:hypothetical protein
MAPTSMLDHDTSTYAEVLDRLDDISRAWRSTRRAMAAQLDPLMDIWDELRDRERSHALPRAMAAHLIADLQSEPRAELRWDLESLRALTPIWEQVSDPRLFDAGRRCLPSIYLSLAGASHKCGDVAGGREYLRRSETLADVVPPGAYRDRLITELIDLKRSMDIGSKP